MLRIRFGLESSVSVTDWKNLCDKGVYLGLSWSHEFRCYILVFFFDILAADSNGIPNELNLNVCNI